MDSEKLKELIMLDEMLDEPERVVYTIYGSAKEELEDCVKLGYNYVAKDKNNSVYVYVLKPYKKADEWEKEDGSTYQDCMKIDRGYELHLSWSSRQPTRIADLLKTM